MAAIVRPTVTSKELSKYRDTLRYHMPLACVTDGTIRIVICRRNIRLENDFEN